jgi:hypothetical protein
MSDEDGGSVYYKTAPLGPDPSFTPASGPGDTMLSWPGALINNATLAKAPISAGSGLIVLASDDTNTRRYYHAELAIEGETSTPPEDPTPPPGDTTAPTVTGTSPASGATGVAVAGNVTATFSEAMNAATITGSTFRLTRGGTAVQAAVTYDVNAKRATLNPAANLAAGTAYTATVTTGAKDAAGNGMTSARTWNFTTAAAASGPVVGDAVERYISKVYDDLFQRAPDATGMSTWSKALRAGTPYGAVANGITYSQEYRSRLISASYQRYLGREPDAAGLQNWLREMQRGMHIEQMQAGFISSPESYLQAGSNDRQWIANLYRSVLRRAAASAEINHWQGQLRAGVSPNGVALGFVYSTEYLTSVVDGYYRDLLGRAIDPSGRQTWVTAIQRGARDEEIIASIVSSAEYRQKV